MIKSFDGKKVADLAAQIEAQIEAVEKAREARRLADDYFRRCETRLENLRSEFTRASLPQLDGYNGDLRAKVQRAIGQPA